MIKIDLYVEKRERENHHPVIVTYFMYKENKVYLKAFDYNFTQFALGKLLDESDGNKE